MRGLAQTLRQHSFLRPPSITFSYPPPSTSTSVRCTCSGFEKSAEVVRVVVDLSFAEWHNKGGLQHPRAGSSLAKQLTQCIGLQNQSISLNHDLSFVGIPRELEDKLRCDHGSRKWEKEGSVRIYREGLEEIFSDEIASGKIIYLSPDASEVLEDVDSETVFIIAGIVDLDSRPLMSAGRAKALNIQAKKLPIRDHLPSCTNQVLNINHVFDILISKPSMTWEEVMLKAVPPSQQQERRRKKSSRM